MCPLASPAAGATLPPPESHAQVRALQDHSPLLRRVFAVASLPPVPAASLVDAAAESSFWPQSAGSAAGVTAARGPDLLLSDLTATPGVPLSRYAKMIAQATAITEEIEEEADEGSAAEQQQQQPLSSSSAASAAADWRQKRLLANLQFGDAEGKS